MQCREHVLAWPTADISTLEKLLRDLIYNPVPGALRCVETLGGMKKIILSVWPILYIVSSRYDGIMELLEIPKCVGDRR